MFENADPKGRGLVALAGIGAKILCELIRLVHKCVGIGRCRLLPRDVGPNCRILAVEVEPLFESRLRIRLDRINRAFGLANTTIDAFVRMDDEHVLTLVEAVHWTHLDTVSVLAADTALVDDVGHLSVLGLSRATALTGSACITLTAWDATIPGCSRARTESFSH